MSALNPALMLVVATATSPTLSYAVDTIVPIYVVVALSVIWASYSDDLSRKSKPASPQGTGAARRSTSHASASSASSSGAPAAAPKATSSGTTCVDMSGSYKLDKNTNYQAFLAIQGVGWALRKAADSATTTHHLKHDLSTKKFHLKIAGLVSSETFYTVDGPSIQTQIKDKIFDDFVTYLPDGNGIRILKVNKKENYTIEVCRRLSADKSTITMEQTCEFRDGSGKKETAIQVFKRVA